MGKTIAVTIAEQKAELQRELALRSRVYRKWINAGTLREEDALRQMARLKAAIQTLDEASDMITGKADMQKLKTIHVEL